MRMRKTALAAAAMVSAALLAMGARADEKSVVKSDGLKLATPTAEQKDALNQLPEALHLTTPVTGCWRRSARSDANWTPPKAPWKFCYNDSYQGNGWRQNALDKYKALVEDYKKKGLASGDLVVTNSNNDINVQLSQLNNLVREGCNVILSIPSSPTGLCSGIKDAHDKGILVVTVELPVVCPDAINVGFNEYFVAAKTAKWVAELSWRQRERLPHQRHSGPGSDRSPPSGGARRSRQLSEHQGDRRGRGSVDALCR